LPVKWNAYVKNPNPVYAVGGLSYEAYDPDREAPLDGIFVAGWSREASSGLVGVARKDGENGAQAVLSYLEQRSGQSSAQDAIHQLDAHLRQKGCRVITQRDLKLLETAERLQAEQRSQEEFKFSSNEEMLAVMGTRETWIHRGGR
jgi:ferredoxin/flavodoxin---NADP+ reductase